MMTDSVSDLRRYVTVGWVGALNDAEYPLPWWCGVPHSYESDLAFDFNEDQGEDEVIDSGQVAEEDEDDRLAPTLEEPSLPSWLESMLLAMCDLTEFRRHAQERKIDHVTFCLVPHSREKPSRFTGVKYGQACVDLFVSPGLASSRDILQVAPVLLAECLLGFRLIAHGLGIPPPKLLMWPGASVPLTVQQQGRVAAVVNCLPDAKRFAVCRTKSQPDGSWPNLSKHELERAQVGSFVVDVVDNDFSPSGADDAVQYDFVAFDQPMFIGELLRYEGVALIGFQRLGHDIGRSDRIATMESVVQEQTGLALRSRGIDGDIRWAAFGEPPDVITPFDDSFADA